MMTLTPPQFAALLDSLLERNEFLIFKKEAGPAQAGDEKVDLYVFSGHLEALRSEEIDGEIMETLHDLELQAKNEDEAWVKIKGFYLERGCTLLGVGSDEYIISDPLARRLGLLDA
jgi:hypothetical protein